MKKSVYKNIQLDDKLEEIISSSEILHLTEEVESCDLKITGDEKSNLKFEKPNLGNLSVCEAYLDTGVIENPLVSNILKNYLEQEFCLRPEVAYKGNIVKNNTLKVLDKSSYGLYSDYICSEAHNFTFNTRSLRKCLTSLFLSFDRMSVIGGIALPLEIDYGRSSNAFFVQFSCNITPVFKVNLLLKSIREFVDFSDCIEITFCNQTNRVVVRNFWFKEVTKKWTSLFIYGDVGGVSTNLHNEEEVVKTHVVEDVTERLVEIDEDLYEDYGDKKQWNLMRITLKSILTLRDEYAIREKDFPTHFNNAIVNALMVECEDGNTFEKLEEHEKEIIIQFINEEDPLESLKRMRLEEMTEIEPEEYIKSIYSKVDEIENDTLKKLSKNKEEDENVTVKGSANEKEDDNVTVKGSANEKEVNQLVKGSGENSEDNSIWNVKKLDVTKNLMSKYSEMSNPSPKQVEEAFEQTMKEVLLASDQNIESYVSGIVDSISEDLLPASIPNSKFIKKTMGSLKNKASNCGKATLDVSPLEIKLMLSFTEKLIRKGENAEDNLKFESGRNNYLKKQVDEMSSTDMKSKNPISEQMRIANEKLIKDRDVLLDEKNKYKSQVLELERKLAKIQDSENLEVLEDVQDNSAPVQTQDMKQQMIDKLTTGVQGARSEALDFKRQLRINEKEMIKLKTQLARFTKSADTSKSGSPESTKSTIRIKQLEKINDQYLSSKTKMEQEISERKSEIHSTKLENKTMANKLKQLEKKLEILNRRKAS